jgi:hypothetical protein
MEYIMMCLDSTNKLEHWYVKPNSQQMKTINVLCLTYQEALDGLGDFKIGGQIIQTVKYADDLVLVGTPT